MELFKYWKIIDDWNVVIAMFALTISLLGFYFFRKYKNAGFWIIKTVALIFFMYTLFVLSSFYTTAINDHGRQDAWIYSVPFELSSMNYIILPILILMNFKNKNISILYFMAFFAGIVTLIATLVSPNSFSELGPQVMYESVLSHAVLFVLPIWCLGVGKIKFDHNDWYKYVLAFVCLGIYGVMVNNFIFKGPHSGMEIMYLKNNVLPTAMQITGFPLIDYLCYASPFILLVFFALSYFNKWNDNSLKKHKEKSFERKLLDSIRNNVNN